jgi:hypothetical protein
MFYFILYKNHFKRVAYLWKIYCNSPFNFVIIARISQSRVHHVVIPQCSEYWAGVASSGKTARCFFKLGLDDFTSTINIVARYHSHYSKWTPTYRLNTVGRAMAQAVSRRPLTAEAQVRCQSQWPCGLRRGSAAVRLLGLWVRIPPGHGCLCCACCIRTVVWNVKDRRT